jgi:golgi phosphoprotein 3
MKLRYGGYRTPAAQVKPRTSANAAASPMMKQQMMISLGGKTRYAAPRGEDRPTDNLLLRGPMTMLTVPEEFLLLTLKDEDGGFVDIPLEYQRAGFVGAAIMELALQGRLDNDLSRVWVVDKTPTGDSSLDPVLARLSAPGFDPSADNLVNQLIELGDPVREQALKRLCDKKILVETEGRLLWFLKTRRYPAIGGKEMREVKLRLLEVLLRDGLPDPRDCCLMSLAETCGIIRQIVPQSELKLARERVAKFSKMELIGQNVNHYIEIFERAMALATPAHM